MDTAGHVDGALAAIAIGLVAAWAVTVPVLLAAEWLRLRVPALRSRIGVRPCWSIAAAVGLIVPAANCLADRSLEFGLGDADWRDLAAAFALSLVVYPLIWWGLLLSIQLWNPRSRRR